MEYSAAQFMICSFGSSFACVMPYHIQTCPHWCAFFPSTKSPISLWVFECYVVSVIVQFDRSLRGNCRRFIFFLLRLTMPVEDRQIGRARQSILESTTARLFQAW
jgi:hypothetical protein